MSTAKRRIDFANLHLEDYADLVEAADHRSEMLQMDMYTDAAHKRQLKKEFNLLAEEIDRQAGQTVMKRL